MASRGFGADAGSGEEAKQSCCRHDNADIIRLHKSADRLYAQFKPQETVAELQQILRIDPHNFEALIKLARAHVDIGDLIPESGTDWKERKVEEYTAAENYARRAVKTDVQST